jgi:hypothetical protein
MQPATEPNEITPYRLPLWLMIRGFGGLVVSMLASGTGGLVGSMLASGTQDRGFKPLRRGNKAVCPMSQICGM